MHRSLNWGTIDTSLASNIEEIYKTMIPLEAFWGQQRQKTQITSSSLRIVRWSHGGSLDVALGTKYSTHVPIISVRALAHEYQIRNPETSTSMTCFRLPSNFCAEKVMHLILGWDCRVFHNSITSVGVSGKNLPHQNWEQRANHLLTACLWEISLQQYDLFTQTCCKNVLRRKKRQWLDVFTLYNGVQCVGKHLQVWLKKIDFQWLEHGKLLRKQLPLIWVFLENT